MLKSRNLDDQYFSDIVEHSIKRIPQLCREWTNYNPADPGITFIELLAWYKEMQQYYMNYYTDDMRLKLLKLLGSIPEPNKEAECIIEVSAEGDAYPKGSRLSTPEGVTFELAESIPEKRTHIAAVYAFANGRYNDITQIIQLTKAAMPMFSFGVEQKNDIVIAFSEIGEGDLSIWFEIEDPGEPVRNKPLKGQKPPRRLKWEFLGYGDVQPIVDETYSLSNSGFMKFRVPKGLQKISVLGADLPGYFLKVSLEDEGCEEQVALRFVSASRYKAVQQESISVIRKLSLKKGQKEILFGDALALNGEFTVFAGHKGKWEQQKFQPVEASGRRGVRLLSDFSEKDETEIIVCSSSEIYYSDLFLSSDGLPNQRIRIDVKNRQIQTDKMVLICDKKDKNGKVTQEIWNYVDSLISCGPEDKVFTFDQTTSEICFGDGEHGCIVQEGESSIFVAQLILTYGSGGNIPSGRRMYFESDGLGVFNTEASGGRDAETADQAAGMFLRRLNNPNVCVSAKDYENMARRTPGLRVLSAKAIPGYDPDEPTGKARGAVVTVIVIPAGSKARPVPNQVFLDTVASFLAQKRNICTSVKVRGPKYIPISIKAELISSVKIKEADILDRLNAALEEAVIQGEREIGAPIKLTWIYSMLQHMPGVLAVRQASIRTANTYGKLTGIGDLSIPPDAVPYVESVSIVQR